MPRVSKRKQYLAKIAQLMVNSNKNCRDIRQFKKNNMF